MRTTHLPFRQQIAEALVRLRKSRNWTVEDAQKRSDYSISARYIRRLESAECSPTLDKMRLLLDVYSTNMRQFFGLIKEGPVTEAERRQGRNGAGRKVKP